MTIVVTGAAGFIGSNLVRHLRTRWPGRRVVSFDALTYCGRREQLDDLRDDPGHVFVEGDVADRAAVERLFAAYAPDAIIHLAAESHVDRSLIDPLAFVRTNVLGTATLLDVARTAWAGRRDVRFHHVSTDEVFGALGPAGSFDERSPYAPSSPYSASKAGADHLVRAWTRSYGLPAVISVSSNNYGPRQYPEKLVPVVIASAVARRPVPVYGRGDNVRDWLYVDDHCEGILAVFADGEVGATYCLGGGDERTNLALVGLVLDRVDRELGRPAGSSLDLLQFVPDRPGHDFRYALDCSRAEQALGWRPQVSLTDGITRTVAWYLERPERLATRAVPRP